MNFTKELKVQAENLTILIVEDNATLNSNLAELFQIFFREVYTAEDGEDGLLKYKQYTPDIILSDITMPRKNGVLMSKEVRDINRYQPIIILSGHRELEYLNQLIEIGITNFIPKPYDLQELLYRLVDVCKEVADNKIKEKSSIGKDLNAIFSEEELAGFHSYDELIRPYARMNLCNDDVEFDLGFTESSIDKLKDLNDYFGVCMQFYMDNLSQEALGDICVILNQLYQILSQLETDNRICNLIHELAVILEDLDFVSLNESQKSKLKFLSFFYNDISRFIKTVYIFKDPMDLDCMVDSLAKTLEQLKLNLSQ